MINWEEIWQIHAPNFKNGVATVTLKEDLTLRLKPGPGFGDLSHPTTSLILEMLKPLVKDKIVVDIGCGTGILSIAAALLGAKAVYPFEIDQGAIAHAKENFTLNDLHLPMNTPPPSVDLVCLNMISSEQRVALAQYPFIKDHPHTLLASGLLEEERERYLSEMAPHWALQSEATSSGWLALNLISC